MISDINPKLLQALAARRIRIRRSPILRSIVIRIETPK